jgi:hypothetical protein
MMFAFKLILTTKIKQEEKTQRNRRIEAQKDRRKERQKERKTEEQYDVCFKP